jgi:hypothetical protein
LHLTDWGRQIDGFVAFAEHVFPPAAADELGDALAETVESCLERPSERIHRLVRPRRPVLAG